MEARVADLRCKEIINVADGRRFGYVGDVELDLESGRIRALVVPGRLRLFGLLGREEDQVFPWETVRRFGEDIILVEREEGAGGRSLGRRRGSRTLPEE
ncbi:MAG TPA: YlmC/YmxH family sporulation protein [Candidatus Galloscillospira excrementavium]|nr:YlmC/YmxH family sporulation protein [Candidatus Galloscillospira excrementavium]